MAQRYSRHFSRCSFATLAECRLSRSRACRRSGRTTRRTELLLRQTCPKTISGRSTRNLRVAQIPPRAASFVPGFGVLLLRGGVMASVAHGGRVLAFAREHKIDYRDVLDFSANLNPLGPSPKALEAIRQSAELVRVYPEETSVRLIRCLSDRLRVPTESILPGNGATELLYFWLRSVRPRTATLVIPTFTE